METYSLNKQPIPRQPLTVEEHHRSVRMALIITAAAVILGGLYWWSVTSRSDQALPDIDPQQKLRAEIISILSSAPQSQASAEDIERITKQLSSAPATQPTPEQRASIINRLSPNR